MNFEVFYNAKNMHFPAPIKTAPIKSKAWYQILVVTFSILPSIVKIKHEATLKFELGSSDHE